jgi:hypothetical protein
MSFLGQPTLSEVRELLAAKEHNIQTVTDAFKIVHGDWMRRNPAQLAAWLADWGGFWNRWQKAAKEARKNLADARTYTEVSLLGDTHQGLDETKTVAPKTYSALMKALTQVSGKETRGDFADLVKRLQLAGGKPDFSSTPQPSSRDADLDAYKAADDAAKAVEHAADKAKKVAGNPLTWIVAGGTVLGVTLVAAKVLK